MKRAFATVCFLAAAMFGSSSLALADGDDYENNPGRIPSFTVSCNAGHGAFEIFRGLQADWIPEYATDGGIGDTTGPANSGAAAACRAQ